MIDDNERLDPLYIMFYPNINICLIIDDIFLSPQLEPNIVCAFLKVLFSLSLSLPFFARVQRCIYTGEL